MDNMTKSQSVVYRMPIAIWVLVGVAQALAIFMAFDALVEMERRWAGSEEYGYGYLIPVITLFLIWQRKDKLESIPFTGSWLGVVLLLIGVVITLIGQLSALFTITQYGFVIAIIGAVYAVMGWTALKIVIVPLLLLFLMVPLPNFVLNNLSSQLQLISSQIGVAVIRLFDISVHLEGNVIDLGAYKLQVVEACSGLRYLFPLIALSIIASYFYQAAVWKRVVVVLSSIPITVLMNSFRIGVIGVLVEFYGIEQAEGFLHDFEGWIVFMACVALLIFEMWALSRFGKDRRPFREVFGMDFPEPTPADMPKIQRNLSPHAMVGLTFLVLGAVGTSLLGGRTEAIPERSEFVSFPLVLDEGWRGHNKVMDSIVEDVLKLDDYILADYTSGQSAVNFYVAYYGSQRSGASAHSPASCLPGGGWRIESRSRVALDDGQHANRFVISMGEHRQLVYYWFKQRDRNITNEFAVKWYLLWDSLTRNRTDGALIRLTSMVRPGEDIDAVEERLREFASVVVEPLTSYVPD
jgi:exosortase D (VPLPA-CTERM-specific)